MDKQVKKIYFAMLKYLKYSKNVKQEVSGDRTVLWFFTEAPFRGRFFDEASLKDQRELIAIMAGFELR